MDWIIWSFAHIVSFCKAQSTQVQRAFNSICPPYKEVSCMCQLFDCPEGLFDMPVLLFEFFEYHFVNRSSGLLLVTIQGVVSLVTFCVHCVRNTLTKSNPFRWVYSPSLPIAAFLFILMGHSRNEAVVFNTHQKTYFLVSQEFQVLYWTVPAISRHPAWVQPPIQ